MSTEHALALTIQKMRAAEEKVAEARGEFYLFGLFEREDAPGRFDLVASAPWLKTDLDGTNELIALLQPYLEVEDWRAISAVFPLEPSTEYVRWLTQRYHLIHKAEETHNAIFNGLPFSRAFLITSNSNPSPAQVRQHPVAA